MTKMRWLIVATLAMATPAIAQTNNTPASPQCTAAGRGGDVCQKTVDLFNYMMPQLGTSLTGTSAIIGQGGTLGGLGHFALDIRANGIMGTVPTLDENAVQPDTGAPQRDTYKTEDMPLALPAASLAVGIFKGIPLGVTNVGGIDALVTATYIPEFTDSTSANNLFSIAPVSKSLQMGYGVRVGLLQESLLLPGISVSYLQRDLPQLNLRARSERTGGLVQTQTEFRIDSFTVKTRAIRVQASKSLLLFRLSAGVGQDTYETSGQVRSRITASSAAGSQTENNNFALAQNVTRTVMYGGVGLNLLLFKIYAEAGQVSGGDIPTYNNFSGTAADATRLFGSIGFRFGF